MDIYICRFTHLYFRFTPDEADQVDLIADLIEEEYPGFAGMYG